MTELSKPYVTADKTEIPAFTPENIKGHCFHKIVKRPQTGESMSNVKTFWQCCFCGCVWTARYEWVKISPREGHGKYAPAEYDYDRVEWSFDVDQTRECREYQDGAVALYERI